MEKRLFPVVLICLAAAGCARMDEIVCSGPDGLFIIDVRGERVWSWDASTRPEIPEAIRSKFRSTDECKPVDGGVKILVTSSGGGVALVERATGKALFWAVVQNAHSAEILPGNRVVVAGSTGDQGNRLVLFDLAVSEKPLFTDELYSGHGVVWDAKRERLWALGERELRAYRLEEDRLIRESTHELPDRGGHDLRPVPGTNLLVVTTNESVHLFDREAKTFTPHPDLGSAAKVKSVDVHPRTGRIAYVQAEERFWARRIRFLDPGGELAQPATRLYKVRWNVTEYRAPQVPDQIP